MPNVHFKSFYTSQRYKAARPSVYICLSDWENIRSDNAPEWEGPLDTPAMWRDTTKDHR